MSEAPREIWLDETSLDCEGFYVAEAENRHLNMDQEYIRHDTHEALLERAVKLALERAASAIDCGCHYDICEGDFGWCSKADVETIRALSRADIIAEAKKAKT
jgi:hypothetical protein